jgi:hypothetical protein
VREQGCDAKLRGRGGQIFELFVATLMHDCSINRMDRGTP